jgi:hypothetical protein
MRRFAYIVAGLFLAVNAVFVGLSLYDSRSLLTLVAVAPALLAALALGLLLIVRNVKPAPEEPLEETGPDEPPE